MSKVWSALLVAAVCISVIAISKEYNETHEPLIFQYVIHNYEEDTAARNAVSSILLNYRMYDTMFETLILLTAIIGMQRFLPAKHELKDDTGGKL
ncbi:hypothetical protein [Spirochaeta dissipatitropha]